MKDMIETTAENELQPAGCRMHNGQQLTLSFPKAAGLRPGYRRQQMLRARAAHWFEIMHRVVESAVEWKPVAPARPEQIALDLRRDTEVQVAK